MKQNLLIGSYSKQGVNLVSFENGSIALLQSESSYENCSCLCIYNKTIYSALEYSNTPPYQNGCIVARNSSLTPFSSILPKGKSPCFLLTDNKRQLLYAANYMDGSIDVFSLHSDGSIKGLVCHQAHTASSHIHYLSLSEDSRFLFASDLGDDSLIVYQIIADGFTYQLKEFTRYQFPIGSGPRHFAVSHNHFYIVTETSCELYQLSFSEKNEFELIDRVSILPKDRKKERNTTGCTLCISQDASFLYCNVRVLNSISVFRIQPHLRLIQSISCQGDLPRDICFDSSETFLLCANQASGDISIFSRDKKEGYLHFKHKYPFPSPACIVHYDI